MQIADSKTEINEVSAKCDRELALKQQAQKLIQTGWKNSLKEIATGFGWVLSGPLGAVVAGSATTIANKLSGDRPLENNPNLDNSAAILEAYPDAAADYLFRLNTETMRVIKAYRDRANPVINPEIKIDRQIDPQQQGKLIELEQCLENIIRSAGII